MRPNNESVTDISKPDIRFIPERFQRYCLECFHENIFFSTRTAKSGDWLSYDNGFWIIAIESGIGTLVKSEVTSKLTNKSLGYSVMLDSNPTKCDEFKICEEVFPVYFLSRSAKYLAKLYVGESIRREVGLYLVG